MQRDVRFRPTLALIRIIECVERHQNLHRVAEELNVKAPTISVAISTFERTSQANLIERPIRGRQIKLTEAGKRLALALRPLLPSLVEAFDDFRLSGVSGDLKPQNTDGDPAQADSGNLGLILREL